MHPPQLHPLSSKQATFKENAWSNIAGIILKLTNEHKHKVTQGYTYSGRSPHPPPQTFDKNFITENLRVMEEKEEKKRGKSEEKKGSRSKKERNYPYFVSLSYIGPYDD